jgi:hypothetical protein
VAAPPDASARAPGVAPCVNKIVSHWPPSSIEVLARMHSATGAKSSARLTS